MIPIPRALVPKPEPVEEEQEQTQSEQQQLQQSQPELRSSSLDLMLRFSPSNSSHHSSSRRRQQEENDDDGNQERHPQKNNGRFLVFTPEKQQQLSPERIQQIERNQLQVSNAIVSYDEDDFSEGQQNGVKCNSNRMSPREENEDTTSSPPIIVTTSQNNKKQDQKSKEKDKKKKKQSWFSSLFSCFSADEEKEDDNENEKQVPIKKESVESDDDDPNEASISRNRNPLAGNPNQQEEEQEQQEENESQSNLIFVMNKTSIKIPSWTRDEVAVKREGALRFALKRIWSDFLKTNAREKNLSAEEIKQDEARFESISPILVHDLEDQLLATTGRILEMKATNYYHHHFKKNRNNDDDDDDDFDGNVSSSSLLLTDEDRQELFEVHQTWKQTVPKTIRSRLLEFFSIMWDFYDPERMVDEDETVFFIEVVTEMSREQILPQ